MRAKQVGKREWRGSAYLFSKNILYSKSKGC